MSDPSLFAIGTGADWFLARSAALLAWIRRCCGGRSSFHRCNHGGELLELGGLLLALVSHLLEQSSLGAGAIYGGGDRGEIADDRWSPIRRCLERRDLFLQGRGILRHGVVLAGA